tara:strand:+ start:1 stop:1812 length:1812 start_codon:yes stop_codon:yes gene_type:complete
MTESEHQMITRSMKRKMDEEDSIKLNEVKASNDIEWEFQAYEDIDENGNIDGFIDYDCEEDFDQEMFQKELRRLGGSRSNFSPTMKKKKKKKNESNKLSEIVLSYILMNALAKSDRKSKKKKSINHIFREIKEEKVDEDNIKIEIGEEEYSSSEDEDYDETILNSGSETESEDEDEDEEYDTYDDQFIELIENDLDEDEELNYFHNLDITEKKKYLLNIENINKITRSNVPLRFKILGSNMDLSTKSIAITNINKLNEMDVSTGEYCKLDKWINGLIDVPFGKYINLPINNENTIKEKRDYLMNTQKILGEAIYGHDDAKLHILQVIGKWIRNPKSQGNVLALQGPMGNGKTTLVKDGISKAINRPFAFIALGGASDSSYFDGHSYTYEGSHWGRIIDILITSKCMNPIIYFDELDKISETYKGDEIIHLLTHLTDPSQNTLFQDNYFPGIYFDLSKVLFIFSFNDENKIDRILKDRMYVINTKGFKPNDKISIARDYLLPELYDTFLFSKDDIIFTDDNILYIIEKFTNKEEGVRNLKRSLETIISKINIYYLSNNETNDNKISINFKIKDFQIPLVITNDIIDELLSLNTDTTKPPEHMYM